MADSPRASGHDRPGVAALVYPGRLAPGQELRIVVVWPGERSGMVSHGERVDGTAAWYAVGLLAVAYLISIVDRFAISLLVTPIKQDLQISDLQMGLLLGLAFGLFYSLVGLPMGRLVDRFNRRNLIIAAIVIWSLMTLTSGLAQNYTQLFLARMGVGIGEAVLAPAAWSMVSDLFPPERRARPISVIAIGSLCGGGLGFIASSSLLDASSLDLFAGIPLLGDLAPWRTVLVVAGLPGLVIGALLLTVREPERDRSTAGASLQGRGGPPAFSDVVRFVWQYRSSLGLVSLGAALIVLTYYSTVSWGPTVLVRQHGLSVSQAGYVYGGFLLISSIAGSYVGGALSDRQAARGDDGIYLRIITVCAAGIALAMIAMLLTSSVTSMVSCLTFYSFSYGLIQGPVIAYVHRLTPSAMRGLVSSMYVLTVNVVGYVIGPSAVALVSSSLPGGEQALGPALGVVCLVSALGALALCVLARKPSRQALQLRRITGVVM